MASSMPVRRTRGVVYEAVGHEILVFDEQANSAHVLTTVAGFVWLRCDGRPTADVTAAMEQELGLAADDVMVSQVVVELASAGLLEPQAALMPRRMMFASVLPLAAPLVRSVLAPAAAVQAASCAGFLQPCSSKPCCSGLGCVLGICVLGANGQQQPQRRRGR